MLRIGLTGGVGCGKTTVANLFRARDVPIIDADEITRELVEPGSEALKKIAEHFGRECLDAKGRLDRAALRERIFEDHEAREALEAILHPRVRTEIERRVATLQSPYCLIVIPLLLESGMQDLVDRVLVVDCAREQQTKRVVARDRVPTEQVEAIIAAQLSRDERLAAADDVIDNSGGPGDLDAEVARLDTLYRGSVE